MAATAPRKGPGRPRSEAARRAILDATMSIVEDDGYGALTMEEIARRAGVSKQTIYRWWPTRAAVLLEALNEMATTMAPDEDRGSLEADLRAFLRRTVAAARGRAGAMTGLMAAAQVDEDFARSFRDGFLARRRAVLRALLERARGRGEVGEDVDIGFLGDLVFASVWYRLLSRHAPLNRRFADELTDALVRLCR
jgi:AcrR family transcriptional regulator